MTLRELQEKTDAWIKENGGYWSEFEILARMTEELGEIASDLQREKGLRPRKQKTDVAGEVGDLLFTLAAFANRKNIDLEKVLQKVFAKYQVRDAKDWETVVQANGAPDKNSMALSELAKVCNQHGGVGLAKQLKARNRKTPRPLPTDAELMRLICVAIAYSQGARSKEVCELIETKTFSQALCGFNIRKLAAQDPALILKKHWHKLGHMRYRGKIKSMVKCAQVLEAIGREYGSFADYLGHHQIPRRIRSQDEFDQFWNGFELLRQDLVRRKMPFFRSTTSLLQLLLDLDYDSVKPDLIVMRLAKRLGMVPKETGERNLRKAVETVQLYCLGKPTRASAVDLMMLVVGGQTGARDLASKRFCPPNGYCHQAACRLGTGGHCSAYRSA